MRGDGSGGVSRCRSGLGCKSLAASETTDRNFARNVINSKAKYQYVFSFTRAVPYGSIIILVALLDRHCLIFLSPPSPSNSTSPTTPAAGQPPDYRSRQRPERSTEFMSLYRVSIISEWFLIKAICFGKFFSQCRPLRYSILYFFTSVSTLD